MIEDTGLIAQSPIDLDDQSTWPKCLFESVSEKLQIIAAERAAETEYHLSNDRWRRSFPALPETDAALAAIKSAMTGRRIRVFHATRLLDGHAVKEAGLHSLDLDQQLAKVRAELLTRGLTHEAAELEELVREEDFTDSFYTCRIAQVWFTPLRRCLHDGGLDNILAHWGGEAIQRITQYRQRLTDAIRSLGNPMVVVASIPAFGACVFSDLRLAPAMLDQMLEREGLIESAGCWDVLLKQDVPPDWIEAILPHDHPSLAWPSHAALALM